MSTADNSADSSNNEEPNQFTKRADSTSSFGELRETTTATDPNGNERGAARAGRSFDEENPEENSESDIDEEDLATRYPPEKYPPEMFHSVGNNRPMPPVPGDERDYLITWIRPDDPGIPTTWSMKYKIWILTLCAVSNLATSLGSAIIGPGMEQIMHEFHVGLPVAVLNVSLYVLGFAFGPMIWGPMSEMVGRKLPITISSLGITIFGFGCASAANFQTLVLCRFFAGAIGASAITVVPAVIADLFVITQRGKAMGIIVGMIFAGPMVAPVIGGYLTYSFLGWRWTQYIFAIFSAFSLVLCPLISETYPPKLLSERAAIIRKETGNWSIGAPLERMELDTKELVKRTVLKPLIMLMVEPILLLLSIYHGFIYGILYMCLEAVPIIFGDYGWHGGNVYLPYLGMLVGTMVSGVFSVVFLEPIFLKKLQASPYPVIPEQRLPLMMISGVLFPIGIFLLCWSGAYKVMWFVPTLGCAFVGFGLFGIFLAAFNYIIDSYLTLAASAMAANTFLRSACGAAFPLFVRPMFRNLGTQWAGTLLGCLAVLLAPVPFFFYFYGVRIRKFSKYAAALETEVTRHSTRASRHSSRHSKSQN